MAGVAVMQYAGFQPEGDMMQILVTGGAGFIGSTLADALLQAGHRVDIVDNLTTGREANIPEAAKFYRTDICDAALAQIFADRQYDVVCHFAAQLDVRRSVEDPVYDTQVNVLGMLNVLQQATAHGVRKVVFASSGGAIYGEQQYAPADEKHPTEPESPYGINKLAGEKFLQYFHRTAGLAYVALRFSNVYGPRQNPFGEAGVIAIFTHLMLAGKQPVIFGDGTQTRDYVFIDDVAAAILSGVDSDYTGIVNIGTGIETDLNTLYAHLQTLTGFPDAPRMDPPKAGEL